MTKFTRENSNVRAKKLSTTMVLKILSSLILVEQRRKLIEVFPDHLKNEWNKWELRVLVLVSLAVQISLIFTGKRRKYIADKRIRIFIWCAYLLADWVATVALGLLVDNQGNFASSDHSNKLYGDLSLMAFWAPFLLIHLGGPDTITAYELADNELWLRHLLGLVVQTTIAAYITLLAWEDPLLSFLTIPMFLCGIIKYGERTWVLMSANQDNFRVSVLTDKEPRPYANFMEEFCLKDAEGYYVTAAEVEEGPSFGYDHKNTTSMSVEEGNYANLCYDAGEIMRMADYFFEKLKFKRLFVDLNLGFHQRDESQDFFKKQDFKTAFEVIEAELGFAYDVFYTKAPIIYTRFGLCCRLMTCFITLTVLLTFAATVGVKSQKHQLVDVVITYVLLIGAVLLEAYSVVSLILSDWAILWFRRNSSKIPLFGGSIVNFLWSVSKNKRWSNSMYQFNLLDFCLNQKSSAFLEILRFIPLHNRFKYLREKVVIFQQLKQEEVTDDLKTFIFKHFQEKSTKSELDHKDLFTCRGAISLKRDKNIYQTIKWTTVDVEFDHSILIWNIATDLFYNSSINNVEIPSDVHHMMTFSKTLADYMLYILVTFPFMLPIEVGISRFRDTSEEALLFFEDTSIKRNKEMLAEVKINVFPSVANGYRSRSILFEGSMLAASLKEMCGREKMWKIVANVWVEILGYAASQCKGIDHTQQLGKGGELLSHVWLLMAHLGISEHFKKKGDGIVKLAVT